MSGVQPWQEALERAGYAGCVGDDIPGWVSAVWIGYSVFETDRAFEAIPQDRSSRTNSTPRTASAAGKPCRHSSTHYWPKMKRHDV